MKYYAVKEGKQPGIYETWAECQKQVYKYPGAVFKAFLSRSEAENYLNADTSPEPLKKNIPFAYVDGSYRKEPALYGWGGFIDDLGKVYIIQGTGNNPAYLKERNIAGEVMGFLQVVHKALALGVKEINIYFDYAGLENWATGAWKTKTPLSCYYLETLELLASDIKINFAKVKGHTGITGNEMADYLAKEAVGAQLRKKDLQALQDFRQSISQEE